MDLRAPILASLLAAAAATGTATRPLSLDEAWSIAASRNPQVLLARAQEARADAVVKQGYALFLPTVEGRATFQDNEKKIAYPFAIASPIATTLGEIVVQPKWTLDYEVIATENVSFHGPGIPLLLQAKDAAASANALSDATKGQVGYAVAQAYYGALAAQALSKIADDARAAADEELRVTSGRVEGGRGTKVELLRAKVHQAESQQASAAARRAADDAMAGLADLLGEPGPFALARPARPVPPADDELARDASPSELARRPDVRAATSGVAAATHGRSAAFRAFYPTLAIEGLYSSYRSSEGRTLLQTPDRFALIGVASVPFFDGGLKYWQLRERRAELAAAEAQAQATGAAASADLRRARRRVLAAREQESLAAQRLELARQARELTQGQYSLGGATQLELLDADNARAAAERDAIQAEYESDLAVLDLRRAMGLPLAEGPTR